MFLISIKKQTFAVKPCLVLNFQFIDRDAQDARDARDAQDARVEFLMFCASAPGMK